MEERERRAGGGGAEEPDWVCAAMLGSLGLFGNGLIQLAASMALADSQKLALTVPERWHDRFGRLFVGGGGGAGDDEDDADATATATATTPTPYRWRPIPDAEAWSLPIVSDRVVLSHPGFRVWMATREPYLSLAAASAVAGDGGGGGGGGGAPLSGRQLRRLFPQAAVADVTGGRGEDAPPPPFGGRGLWGWFQWPTASLAGHARLLLGGNEGGSGPLRLRPDLARTLDAAVDALVGCYCDSGAKRRRKVIAVHLRRGDCAGTVCPEKGHATTTTADGGGEAAPPPPPPPVLRTEPPFELGTGEAWDDQGLCWRTPLEWLRPALELALEAGEEDGDGNDDGGGDDDESPPLVVLCTDDPHLARDPSAVWPGAATWASAAASGAADHVLLGAAVARAREALRRARRGGGGGGGEEGDGNATAHDDDLHMLLDWRLMQHRAVDALLISNSTFSFTAAWLSGLPTTGERSAADHRPRRFFRPCPQARGFAQFDPWDSLPLLPSRANLPKNHGVHGFRERQQELR